MIRDDDLYAKMLDCIAEVKLKSINTDPDFPGMYTITFGVTMLPFYNMLMVTISDIVSTDIERLYKSEKYDEHDFSDVKTMFAIAVLVKGGYLNQDEVSLYLTINPNDEQAFWDIKDKYFKIICKNIVEKISNTLKQ